MTDILTEEEEREIEDILTRETIYWTENCHVDALIAATPRMLATIREMLERLREVTSERDVYSLEIVDMHNKIVTLESQLATAKAHLPLVYD